MTQKTDTDHHSSSGRGARSNPLAVTRPLSRLMNVLRDRLQPSEYVDWADAPDVPESPYRARLSSTTERGSREVEVGESEVVRGEVTTIYEVRCPCGKRWFNLRPEHMQLCPRCNRAVLLDAAATPTT
jgi:hypothetical protein